MKGNQPLLGGAKEKNGHKQNCSCHICKNIQKKAENGGYDKITERKSTKKNGHKESCSCPICVNMKNAKKKKRVGGDSVKKVHDEEEGEEEGEQRGGKKTRKRRHTNGHKSTCKCPICKNMKNKKKTSKNNRMFGFNLGGTRKRRHTNCHKRTCKCPICKNMKKKTHRRHSK